MSVIVRGMAMPKTAGDCSVKIDPETRKCIYTGKEFEETLSLLLFERCKDCPLEEVEAEAAAAAERIAKAKSPVIRKMVPLDHLKRCADLCISVGWTLEQFRKNMDEWEGDALDITVTG